MMLEDLLSSKCTAVAAAAAKVSHICTAATARDPNVSQYCTTAARGLPTSEVLLLDNVSTAAAYPSPSLWSDYTKLHRWPAAA